MTTSWKRLDRGSELGYETDGAQIHDNGDGFGKARGSGRWAVEVDGKWLANVDTLVEAKQMVSDAKETR